MEQFNITSPQFNEQISPVPWHFIKLRFHCNFTLSNSISILPLTWSNFCFPSDYFYIHVNLPLITWTMLWVPDKSKKVHCSPKHCGNYFNNHVFVVFKKSPSIIPIMWNPEYSPGIEPWCFLLQSMIKFVCLLVCFVFVFFMHPQGIPVWENNGTPTLVRPKSEI